MDERSLPVRHRLPTSILVLFFCVQFATTARAEATLPRELPLASFNYSMALAVGDLNSFVGDVSFRGFEISVLWPVQRSLFLGASFGYNGFHDRKDRALYQLESGAITAPLYRYADAWPFALASRYVLQEVRSPVRPYLGLRLGLEWIVTTTYVVGRSYEDSGTGLLISPETGLMLRMSRSLLAQLAYQFSFSTASTSGGDVLSYNGLQLGLAFVL